MGGTLNYSTSKSTSDDMGVAGGQSGKSSSYINNAILGVFVSDRTVLGLNFEINSYSNESTSLGQEFRYGFNQFGFGPFLRRYFPVKEWVAFYGQAQLGYGFGKIKQNYSSTPNQNSERSTNTFNLSATFGLAFFPTNWMSVDLAMNPLSFAHSVNKDEVGSGYPDQKTNTFNFNLSSQAFQIGAHFFLNKK